MNIGQQIKLIISDFDGTLVDTFKANYLSYNQAFKEVGLTLSENTYRNCFGLRFDEFMSNMNIFDENTKNTIKKLKHDLYPNYFDYLVPNKTLFSLITAFHNSGGKTALASTASRQNLLSAVNCFSTTDIFDIIISGEDVKKGKPSPEIFLTILSKLEINKSETIIFEDSITGINAARKAGINYIKVNNIFYEN